MGFALHALAVGIGSGLAAAMVVYGLSLAGNAGWFGESMVGLMSGGSVLILLMVGVVCGLHARRAMSRDAVIDESLAWSRRVLAALGTQTGDTPAEYCAIRVWPPSRSLWVALPGGWVVLLVVCMRDVLPMWRACRRWSRNQRKDYGAKAAQCLYEYASAIDAVTLASPTGTYFGCLVHPVQHATRARLVQERLFGGVSAVLVPGLAWGGGLLTFAPFGRLWWSILVSHVIGAAAVWALGIVRVRWMVALAWESQSRGLRYTLRAAVSERDAVMRLVENSTLEGV